MTESGAAPWGAGKGSARERTGGPGGHCVEGGLRLSPGQAHI